ncbi:unnamed protein product [Calicophoron daubneyi]|uniref:Protein kinase domain-containing protein n=1 Tax=Calicophoron daubneyi TaxID=300641 RepID=A0AAV2TW05_CALDB
MLEALRRFYSPPKLRVIVIVPMGNGSSECLAEPIDPQLLRGGIVNNKTFLYEVAVYHTSQRTYSRCSVLKFTRVDRENECGAKLNDRPKLRFCLEKNFQITGLLKNASIPIKCRHPCILRVDRSFPDPVANSLFLVTESCLPLSVFLENLEADDVLLGSRSILRALSFLHDKLSLSHNNLRSSSVFVDYRSMWKLGGFEYALPFVEMNANVIELLEVLNNSSDDNAFQYDKEYPFCYDIYLYSKFICEVSKKIGTDEFAGFTQVLQNSCMHSQPRARLPPSQLLSHHVFQHPLVLASEFLENYMMHSDSDKEEFFREFEKNVAGRLPVETLCKKILPKCFENNVFLDYPCQELISRLLHPSADLTLTDCKRTSNTAMRIFICQSTFKTHLLPLVLGKFRLRERQTRMILLENFSGYSHILSVSDLRDTVLPEVCIGVYDFYEPLSSLSLCCLGALSKTLGANETLNVLRSTEISLYRDHKLSSPVANAKSPLKTKPLWPRAHLFSEAGPKMGRQQRDIPFSEERKMVNRTRLTLAQLATLSPNYQPDLNSKLRAIPTDDDGTAELRESARKITTSEHKKMNQSLAIPLIKINSGAGTYCEGKGELPSEMSPEDDIISPVGLGSVDVRLDEVVNNSSKKEPFGTGEIRSESPSVPGDGWEDAWNIDD